MVVVRKMLNKLFKWGLLLGAVVFLFFSFSSFVFAVNYGVGLYSFGIYSAIPPGTPIVSPVAGLYNTTQSVTLTGSGSTSIRYSTTGIPATCSNDSLYSTPISISSSKTIYVRACDAYGNSSTASFAYIIDTTPPSIPTATPIARTYNATQLVTLNAAGSDYIKYATDTTPASCSSGTLYGGPISVSSSQTIYVRACDLIGNSSVSDFTYIIDNKTTSSGSSGGGGSYIAKTIVAPTKVVDATFTSPAYPTLVLNRILTIKTKGEDVKVLQKYLKNNGYSISLIDGIFGEETKIAVVKFQNTKGLHPDGIVGAKTKELMVMINNSNVNIYPDDHSKYIFSKNLKFGSVNNDKIEVYQLQKYLNSRGYLISKTGLSSPGNENQIFGLLVKKALIKFQMANKLNSDGIFGYKTREVMNTLK